MAPVTAKHPREVYERLYKVVEKRNKAFYEKYPGDKERIAKIVAWLEENTPELPSGGKLTVNRFRELGMVFGQHGGIDNAHRKFQPSVGQKTEWLLT